MNILVVEDDVITRKLLHKIIETIDENVHIIASDNEHNAVELLMKQEVDLFMLDIKIKEGSGYSLAQKIRNIEKYKLTPIVFITAVDHKELEAYRNIHCYSYIVKPFNEKKVKEVLSCIIKGNKKEDNIIKIDKRSYTYLISIDDVLYIEAQSKDIVIKKINDKETIKNYPLKKIYMQLEDKGFIKCHRSFIVNKKYIKEILLNQNEIVMYQCKNTIPLGRKFKDNF